MRTLFLMALAGFAALACSGAPAATAASPDAGVDGRAGAASPEAGVRANWHLLEVYCEKCHNTTDWAGGVAFDTMSPEAVPADAAIWEKAVRKLGGSIMPPPGKPQPDPAARRALVLALQNELDRAAAAHPNPG